MHLFRDNIGRGSDHLTWPCLYTVVVG